MVSIDSLDLFW